MKVMEEILNILALIFMISTQVILYNKTPTIILLIGIVVLITTLLLNVYYIFTKLL
jgi:hypothetical protein